MSAWETLLWLITTGEEWLEALRLVCCYSTFHLRFQVWQFREQLRDRGREFDYQHLKDARGRGALPPRIGAYDLNCMGLLGARSYGYNNSMLVFRGVAPIFETQGSLVIENGL